ncbi:MAG: N-acetyltransferase, partial [Pseudolabrys sp.]
MSEPALTIRPETAADAPAVERLHERTVGPGRFARTAFR